MSLDLGLWPLMFWVLSVPKHAFNNSISIWPLKESTIIPMANSHGLNQVKRVIKVFSQYPFDRFGALLVVPISWRLHEWDDEKWCMLELKKKKFGKAELVEPGILCLVFDNTVLFD